MRMKVVMLKVIKKIKLLMTKFKKMKNKKFLIKTQIKINLMLTKKNLNNNNIKIKHKQKMNNKQFKKYLM